MRNTFDAEGLGPLTTDLGSIVRTANGKRLAVVWGAMSLLILGMVGAVIVAYLQYRMESAEDIADQGTGIFGAILLLFMVVMGAFAGLFILGFVQLLRTSLRLHDEGIDARQSWFRSAVLPWAHVAAIHPPDPLEKLMFFRITTADGKRLPISRLNLAPTKEPGSDESGPVSRFTQHPDVVRVIESYEAWCRRNDRPIEIR